MTETAPLVVGAAMRSVDLPMYRDWLLEKQRDIEIQDAISPEVLDGNWRETAATVNAALDGHTGRRGIHGPFLTLTLAPQDPKIQQVTIERLKQGLEFAAEVGATHMVTHSPVTYLGQPVNKPKSTLSRMQETLAEVVPVAEQANCTLMVENIFDYRPDWHAEMVRGVESDFVRVSIDTGHAYITSLQYGAPPDVWIRQAGDLLGHVHLQDTDGIVDRHWAAGQGQIRWHSVFKALRKLEQRPRLIIEMMQVEDIAVSARYFVEQGLAE
jgi:sugar phosphate isomerase/epimerase